MGLSDDAVDYRYTRQSWTRTSTTVTFGTFKIPLDASDDSNGGHGWVYIVTSHGRVNVVKSGGERGGNPVTFLILPLNLFQYFV